MFEFGGGHDDRVRHEVRVVLIDLEEFHSGLVDFVSEGCLFDEFEFVEGDEESFIWSLDLGMVHDERDANLFQTNIEGVDDS